MAAPIYFFPGVLLADLFKRERFRLKVLSRYGLDQVLGDLEIGQVCRQDRAQAGPGGHSGALLTYQTDGKIPVRTGYHPEFQHWTRVQQEPKLWIGIDKEHPPGIRDIAKPNRLPGHLPELLDGQRYEIPVIRSLDPTRVTTDADMYWDESGKFVTEPTPDAKRMAAMTEEIWNLFYSRRDPPPTMLYSRAAELCIDILSINYRYGRHEHRVWREHLTPLFRKRDDSWRPIFEAVIDWPLVLEAQAEKKTDDSPQAPGTASTEPGVTGDCPVTAPAAENSFSPPSGSDA